MKTFLIITSHIDTPNNIGLYVISEKNKTKAKDFFRKNEISNTLYKIREIKELKNNKPKTILKKWVYKNYINV